MTNKLAGLCGLLGAAWIVIGTLVGAALCVYLFTEPRL